MKKIICIILIFFSFILEVQGKEDKNLVNIYLFHSNTCPHCKEEIEFLQKVEEKYENVVVYKYEITENSSKKAIENTKSLYNIKLESVPVTIIGDKIYTGYSNELSPSKLITTIDYYSIYGYEDKLGETLDIPLPKENKIDSRPSVTEYIKQNSNSDLLFNLKTDEVDLNTASTILGIKTSSSLLNLLSILLITFLILRTKPLKEKIITIFLYILICLLNQILLYMDLQNIIVIFSVISFFACLTATFKRKKNIIRYSLIILIENMITFIPDILSQDSNIIILKKIFNLNLSSTYTIILNTIIYIMTHIFINIIILFICYKVVMIILEKQKIIKQRKEKFKISIAKI